MTPQQLKALILADSAAASLFAQKQYQPWRELAFIQVRLGEMD
jgi:hypothetical protein